MSLSKFVHVTSGSDGADKVAKLLGYGLSVFGHTLGKLDTKGGNSETATALKALGTQISMARYVTRLTGIVESLEALQNDSWAYEDDSEHIKSIVKWQAYSMVLYYPLENASWIGWTAPNFLPSLNPDAASRHSCVLWTLYVILDIYANYIRYKACESQISLLQAQKKGNYTKINRLQKQKKEIGYNLVRGFLYLPNAIHWSFEKEILPGPLVQFLGLAEAIVGGWRKWVNTK